MAIPGRNEPCPCGSGKRYKLCHGRIDSLDEKVAFVVAGTQKGGTSALATYMIEHPKICMPKEVKEVHFFDTEENFASAPVDYTRYHAHYERKPGQVVLGDATPIYMYWDAAPLRIWQYNPAMKFIFLLRNPGTRAYSQWNMEVKKGRETLSFEEAIRTERERCREVLPLQHRRWSYIDRGIYSGQLRRIWRHFPIERTLVFRSEKFQVNPAPALDRIAEFLGVGPFPRTTPRKVFELPYDRPMSDEARRLLRDAFAAEIDELERMLNWDCSGWRAELA
jgi:hypothetical protein